MINRRTVLALPASLFLSNAVNVTDAMADPDKQTLLWINRLPTVIGKDYEKLVAKTDNMTGTIELRSCDNGFSSDIFGSCLRSEMCLHLRTGNKIYYIERISSDIQHSLEDLNKTDVKLTFEIKDCKRVKDV